MENIDKEVMRKIVESLVILGCGLVLFLGLKGRILQFAQWANLPRLAFAPVRLTFRYAILGATLFLILSRWGFQLGTLLAVLGTILGLVAIGFVAVWSVLSNFLCTFVLILFKPFSVGDYLEIPADAVKGKVVDLTLIFTTLHGADDEYVHVPNNMFFQKIFKRRAGSQAIDLEHQLRQDKPIE